MSGRLLTDEEKAQVDDLYLNHHMSIKQMRVEIGAPVKSITTYINMSGYKRTVSQKNAINSAKQFLPKKKEVKPDVRAMALNLFARNVA